MEVLVEFSSKLLRKFSSEFIRNWQVVCLQRILKYSVKMSGNVGRSHKLVQASADRYGYTM
jgi:hypothetical protein